MSSNQMQGYATATEVPRERTLTERLNKVAEGVAFQCDRIEGVLGRVNGTPSPIGNMKDVAAQIRPTVPLAQTVEALEMALQRLSDLSTNVERIA